MLRIVRYTLLLLAIAVIAITSFGPGVPAPASGMKGVEPGLRGPDAAAVIFPGDVNCSGATDGIDSLQILSFGAGVSTTTDCLQQHGNVNCDASIDAADAVLDLRYAAGLPIGLTQSCPSIGGPPSAQALTRALNTATTPGDADWVLKLIYQQIGVGVYTGDGQQILAGHETSLDDFYLYDFESALLAGNYVAQQWFGLDTAPAFLDEAGVTDPISGQSWNTTDVLAVLTQKVTAARADESPSAWRLIDELGRQREEPLDLTSPALLPDTTYLDSIQTLLLLYEIISGQSASPSTSLEDVGVADVPDAGTKALHDYSLLAQAYHPLLFEIEPTHWRHGGNDKSVIRQALISVEFQAGPDMPQAVRSGPLRDVALPSPGGVPGVVVDWFLDKVLLRNGRLEGRPASRITDSNGQAYDNFIPRPECPVGIGEEVDEEGTLSVVSRLAITSVFPPHTLLDSLATRGSVQVLVSHHTGKAAQPSGGAVPSKVFTSLDDLPCKWTGTAHVEGNEHGVPSRVFTVDATFTVDSPYRYSENSVIYLMSGEQATWHVSSDCPYERSGTSGVSGSLVIPIGARAN